MRIKKEWIGMFALLIILSILFVFNLDSPTVIVDVVEESPLMIKVYISGQVKSPGVYDIEEDQRLDKLVELAGGFTELANKTSVNLARKLKDGEMIVIYELKDQVEYYGLDIINYGTSQDIESIDGIGEVLAKRMISYRESNGLFTSYEDLLNVEGIGESKLKMIQDDLGD